MADDSRNFIVKRRGSGIADLTNITLENGELTLEQADQAGIYKINCTHQVGIATATEVGLTADRFPIRVILAADAGAVTAFVDQAACSYWRLVDAAGRGIPFARKPVQSDIVLKNIMKYAGDFDNTLWTAYKRLNLATAVMDHTVAMDNLNEQFYAVANLLNPTTEQQVQISQYFDNLVTATSAQNRVPYIKVADGVFLSGTPHGSLYTAVGTMNADRAALVETCLCMSINHRRFKARYDNLSDGAVTLAAYSVANMFRFGLFESFEHKEYHTVIMVPVANNAMSFSVAAVRTPTGIAPPADLPIGHVVDITAVKFKKTMVEIANLMVVGSGLMHYLFNHTTGGNVVTGTLLTVLAMYKFVHKDMPMEEQVNITALFYEALHPTNKRAIANLFFRNSFVTTHGRCASAPRYELFSLDSFVTIRKQPYPAGSHKAFICLQALRRVLQAGLGAFLPWADQLTPAIAACKDILSNGARSHIGSAYYTGEAPIAQPSQLDYYLPDLAIYVQTFHKGDSLSMSPHLSVESAKRAGANWTNMLKALKANDISATSVDVVKQFLSTAGAVHFAFDPQDQATWGKAVGDAGVALRAIDQIFN